MNVREIFHRYFLVTITHKQFVQVIFEEFKDLVNTEILGEYESIH